MNVNDFDNRLPDGDLLKIIWARQEELVLKYEPIEEANLKTILPKGAFDLNDCRSQQRLKDFAWRITEELGEAMNCLKNKPWKVTQMTTDETHYREELVDALHFFIELLMHSGFEPESLTRMYLNKSDVNRFRIRSRY